MATTRRKKIPASLRLKKAAPALLFLALLGYLGATNLFGGNDSGAIVQQAEAYVIEQAQFTADNTLELNSAFSSVQQWVPSPNPETVELEGIVSSTDQGRNPKTQFT